MATANKVKDGCDLLYVNPSSSAAIAAFDVVELRHGYGVAQAEIAASGTGTVAQGGRWRLPKATGAGTAIAQGARLGWDAGNTRVSSAETGKLLGYAAAAATDDDATVQVDLGVDTEGTPALAGKLWEFVALAGGSKTLDAQDVAKVIDIIDGDASNVVTLPATAAGLVLTIRLAVDGGRLAVSPNASDLIFGADFAGVDNKDRILAAANSKAGDYIQLLGNGTTGWSVLAERGVWSNEA